MAPGKKERSIAVYKLLGAITCIILQTSAANARANASDKEYSIPPKTQQHFKGGCGDMVNICSFNGIQQVILFA